MSAAQRNGEAMSFGQQDIHYLNNIRFKGSDLLKKIIRILTLPGLLISDTLICLIAAYLGLIIRYDGVMPQGTYDLIPLYWCISAICVISLGILIGCYFSVWSRAGVPEMIRQFIAVFTTYGIVYLLNSPLNLNIPRGAILITALIVFLSTTGLRMSVRIGYWGMTRFRIINPSSNKKRVLIVGGGSAGTYLANHLLNNPQEGFLPVGIIDDNKALWNHRINGLPVYGGREFIQQVVRKQRIDEVIIAINHADKQLLNDVFQQCKAAKCRIKRFDTMELMDEKDLTRVKIRDVSVEELLGRDPVNLDMLGVKKFIGGMTVLVTGGAGSIGSEICRQVLSFGCKELIIFDFSENGLFDINNELSKKYSPEQYHLVLGSIREKKRLDEVFEQFKPDVVFHAAAHKHVPMMEWNPFEAIKNNVFGTINVMEACDKYHVKKFILISTDKAVNPPNIMGASKRIAELAMQMINAKSETEFAAVRFGNVLGSNGSVIPYFKKQIAEGGPVTVTHPDVKRYFMTIPEAVQLVLQAGAMANGGEIFVLEMGEPVKIVDLAVTLIQLSGLEPNKDIKITFTGLRPGEKLFEEINLTTEDVSKTSNNQIYVLKQTEHNYIKVSRQLDMLKRYTLQDQHENILQVVKEMVPTYELPENDNEANGNSLSEKKQAPKGLSVLHNV